MSVLQDIAPEGAFDSTATYGMAEQLAEDPSLRHKFFRKL